MRKTEKKKHWVKWLKNIFYSSVILILGIIIRPCGSVMAKSTYIQKWDLYDFYMKIEYKNDNSAYYYYIKEGAEIWNKYKPDILREDTAFTIADCTIMDIAKNNSINATTYSDGYIKFNRTNMERISGSRVYNVAIHELGHALGIAHVPVDDDLMYKYTNTTTTLSYTDKKSYEAAYHRYYSTK